MARDTSHGGPSGMPTIFGDLAREVGALLTERIRGRVDEVHGLTVRAAGLPAPVGARCAVHTRPSGTIEAEVVALRGDRAILSVFGEATGLSPGDWVECRGGAPRVAVGADLLGRVIDAQGRPLDGKAPPATTRRVPLYADPPDALRRRPIDAPLALGVRAIDGLLTTGLGQRIGVFAGTGVGKSVLMGMICRNTAADVNVVALVGERGREVRDFVEQQLGDEGLRRSVVVVCTSDQAPALRVRACYAATAIAEFFRDRGANVLLMMDSITRMAMAQRQIGLAAGEPPTTRGYPPSVFALLPRLLERAGRTHAGSITGVYTVLVEGGDIDEPLADAVRGILDGHLWLSRSLANRGHYPAVDVLQSVSRVADDVVRPEQRAAALAVRRVLATWNDIEDLVSIGAYVRGANVEYDVALATKDALFEFLRQDRGERCAFADTTATLLSLSEQISRARHERTRT